MSWVGDLETLIAAQWSLPEHVTVEDRRVAVKIVRMVGDAVLERLLADVERSMTPAQIRQLVDEVREEVAGG